MEQSNKSKLDALTEYRDEIARQITKLKQGTGITSKLTEAKTNAEDAVANIITEIENLIKPDLAPTRAESKERRSNDNIKKAEKLLKLHTVLKNSKMIDIKVTKK